MFRTREVAQFGVKARPHLPLSPKMTLPLLREDPRTEEEKERDTQREAERLTYQLFAQPLVASISITLQRHPDRYLEHLHNTPQLPAPPERLLLSAVAHVLHKDMPRQYHTTDVQTFEQWLDTPLGTEVFWRIMHNKHRVSLEMAASNFDTPEDIQQKALIWLWEQWQRTPGYVAMTRHAQTLRH